MEVAAHDAHHVAVGPHVPDAHHVTLVDVKGVEVDAEAPVVHGFKVAALAVVAPDLHAHISLGHADQRTAHHVGCCVYGAIHVDEHDAGGQLTGRHVHDVAPAHIDVIAVGLLRVHLPPRAAAGEGSGRSR